MRGLNLEREPMKAFKVLLTAIVCFGALIAMAAYSQIRAPGLLGENEIWLEQQAFDANGLAICTVNWATNGNVRRVAIVVGPDTEGVFRTFAVMGPSGKTDTKRWVRSGMLFMLLDASDGRLLASKRAD